MTHDDTVDGAGVARRWRGGAGSGPGPAAAAPTAPYPPVSPEGYGGGIGRFRPDFRGGAAAGGAGGNGAGNGAERRDTLDAETVAARLEEAGATLLALPERGYSTGLASRRYDIVRSALESYGWQGAQGGSPRLRPPVPSAAAITRMDQAFGWLALIPADRYVLRRIVSARALVSPLTGRHMFSWRRLGMLLGADHKAVQRWHGQGVGLIVRGQNSGARVRKARLPSEP
jgi:hypothetical protein